VFWKITERGEADEGSEEQEDSHGGRRFCAHGYSVLNAAQVDGFEVTSPALLPEAQRIERAETFFAGLGAAIQHGGNRAFYRPAEDRIQVPPSPAFADSVAYYATLAREVTHSTGHPSRCARDLKGRFGEEAYAAEELVAELGAAFLCVRPGPRLRAPAGSRRLRAELAEGSAGRQAGDLYRRRQGPGGSRLRPRADWTLA